MSFFLIPLILHIIIYHSTPCIMALPQHAHWPNALKTPATRIFSWTTVPYLNCSFFAKLLIIMTFYRRYGRVNDVGKINRHYVYYKISTDIKLLRHEWIPCLTPKLCQKTHKRGGCSFPSQWVRLSANRRSQFASEQSATRAQTPVAKLWMPISTLIYRYWINCQNSLKPLTPRLFNRRPPFNILILPNICYEMFWLKQNFFHKNFGVVPGTRSDHVSSNGNIWQVCGETLSRDVTYLLAGRQGKKTHYYSTFGIL